MASLLFMIGYAHRNDAGVYRLCESHWQEERLMALDSQPEPYKAPKIARREAMSPLIGVFDTITSVTPDTTP
jgi:hypothetical protein